MSSLTSVGVFIAVMYGIITQGPVVGKWVYDNFMEEMVEKTIQADQADSTMHNEQFTMLLDSLSYERNALMNHVAQMDQFDLNDKDMIDTNINGVKFKYRKHEGILYYKKMGLKFMAYRKPRDEKLFIEDAYGVERECR